MLHAHLLNYYSSYMLVILECAISARFNCFRTQSDSSSSKKISRLFENFQECSGPKLKLFVRTCPPTSSAKPGWSLQQPTGLTVTQLNLQSCTAL